MKRQTNATQSGGQQRALLKCDVFLGQQKSCHHDKAEATGAVISSAISQTTTVTTGKGPVFIFPTGRARDVTVNPSI